MRGVKPRKRIDLPTRKQTWYMRLTDGTHVDVTIDWREVYLQSRRAIGAVSQESNQGPVRVKVPKLQPERDARRAQSSAHDAQVD